MRPSRRRPAGAFPGGITAATRDLFESAGLPELADFRWDREPRDTGFTVSGLARPRFAH